MEIAVTGGEPTAAITACADACADACAEPGPAAGSSVVALIKPTEAAPATV
ncbi:hypothetical protein [Kitasatospora terrestris]|uniref:hypothetical protein n=1 Tax=Kitasatospora terrestris TaxID=258051 RepID=UPI0031EF0230